MKKKTKKVKKKVKLKKVKLKKVISKIKPNDKQLTNPKKK